MSVPELSERYQRLAAATLAAAQSARQGTAARRGQPAAPGDRYTLRATAELPVEWILLERHPRRAAFRAVPADTHPLAGSADLAVPSSPLVLRCGAAVWVEESALEPACRAGAVDRLTVERARQKLAAAGREPASDEQIEIDGSPEYGDWMQEVVKPALAAVGIGAPEWEPAPAASRSFWKSPLPYAAAASVLLLLSLALAVWAGRQRAEVGRLAALQRGAETALAGERSRQAQALLRAQQGWQRRLEENRSAAAELERRLAELEKGVPKLPEAVLNAPLAILSSTERVRGEEPKVARIDPVAAPYLTVALNLDDNTPYASYRVVLTRQGSRAPVWKDDRLERKGRGIQLALDRRLVPPGFYHFQVSGLRGARAEPLAEYDLIVSR